LGIAPRPAIARADPIQRPIQMRKSNGAAMRATTVPTTLPVTRNLRVLQSAQRAIRAKVE
jgi:hypothetical protein